MSNNYAALALKKLGEQRKAHQTSSDNCPTCKGLLGSRDGRWLQEQIELVWGEHSPHAEVFRELLRRAR